MKLSAKTEYACVAMLHLAQHASSGQPIQIRRIADEHDIPSRFLVQILLQLKYAGLVASVRGASGGYRLLKSPSEINLSQVIRAIEGDDSNTPLTANESSLSRVLHSVCNELTQTERTTLESLTLASLLERSAEQTPMWHI